MHSDRKRVAILGGGPAGLSAAYQLTAREPGRHSITIYEQSFRLGGKTASGRGEHQRIEEHGLHVLFGAYHNAFATMVDCYDSLSEASEQDPQRPAASPEEHRFRHFLDALEPCHFGVIGDDRDGPGHWRPWDWQFPSNRSLPGQPPLPTTRGLLSTLLQLGVHVVFGAGGLRTAQRLLGRAIGYGRRLPRRRKPTWRERALDPALEGREGEQEPKGVLPPLWFAVLAPFLDRETACGRLAYAALRLAHRALHLAAPCFHARFVRRTFLASGFSPLDFGLAVGRGIAFHGLLVRSRRRRSHRGDPAYRHWGYFDRIDAWDFRDWLDLHGVHPRTRNAPLVRIVYDAAFSYLGGDGKREIMGAGTVLRIMLLMGFTYKSAMYFKMKAGMGDVISAPLYRVLRARGVRFEFFHRVLDVVPGSGEQVQRVVIERLSEARYEEPVRSVSGLLTWPSEPYRDAFSDAGEHADAARADRYFHRPTRRPRRIQLELGEHFDQVVFALPVGAIPYAAPSLVAAASSAAASPERAKWGEQSRVEAVQTAAVQLWFRPRLEQLGWGRPAPLLSLFHDPLNTYCAMDQTLDAEAGWPGGSRPGHVAYFCGALPHEHAAIEPELYRARWESPARFDASAARLASGLDAQLAEATRSLLDQLSELLPRVEQGHRSAEAPDFNFSLLVDSRHADGVARLRAQYRRVNSEPWERCTLAVPGATKWRMRAGETGYENLVVAGDWTRNGLNAACFEGAIVSGIFAARALSDRPELYPVAGERLFNIEPPEDDPTL